MPVGAPLAVTGPFSVIIAGSERQPQIEFRMTIETLERTPINQYHIRKP
jgi:hypothetical protein